MSDKIPYEQLLNLLEPKKSGDHAWFLSLLDEDAQRTYEDEHIAAVMQMLRIARIRPHKNAVREAKAEIARLEREESDNEICIMQKQKSWLPLKMRLKIMLWLVKFVRM